MSKYQYVRSMFTERFQGHDWRLMYEDFTAVAWPLLCKLEFLEKENADLRARLKSAEEERDALKCCGNCKQFSITAFKKPDCAFFGDLHKMKMCQDWTPRKARS